MSIRRIVSKATENATRQLLPWIIISYVISLSVAVFTMLDNMK